MPDGVTFDGYLVPAVAGDDDTLPSLTITLQPSGTWTVTDALGHLIKSGASAADVV